MDRSSRLTHSQLMQAHMQHRSAAATAAHTESLDRAYIMICLKRFRGASSRYAAYECLIHEVTGNLPVAIQIADKQAQGKRVRNPTWFLVTQVAENNPKSVRVASKITVIWHERPVWTFRLRTLHRRRLPRRKRPTLDPKMDDSMVAQLRADVDHHLKRTLRMAYHACGCPGRTSRKSRSRQWNNGTTNWIATGVSDHVARPSAAAAAGPCPCKNDGGCTRS
ncbi:hypothetical protein PsorP6_013913 [Peronosclerospora sorghi]|uniref:Uncharacterized protein n=1 Tax=Peronosclerospora sorghi TaxID=230839 RepID=A0ACC0VHP7_9STRA|nr:hypothetical protein PsorP6_013913 [Peronosclerospora sorghi]